MGLWYYILSNSIVLLCIQGNIRCLEELMNIQGVLLCNELQLRAVFIHIHLSKAWICSFFINLSKGGKQSGCAFIE